MKMLKHKYVLSLFVLLAVLVLGGNIDPAKANISPSVDAGISITISLNDVDTTWIYGTVTDPDNTGFLKCAWENGSVQLTPIMDVILPVGTCPLELSSLDNPDAGTYTLVLYGLDGSVIVSDSMILTLVDSNNVPIADAGPDITITTDQIDTTIIPGTIIDPYNDNPLRCAWYEDGKMALTSISDVGPNGECPLDLSQAFQTFETGSHSLVLYGIEDSVIFSVSMVLTISNTPPVADAGATTSDVSCLATSCEITLDGSQSSDPDSTTGTNDDIEFFEWYDENGVLIATGETAVVTLPLGMHNITLRVIDYAGASGEYTITIVIDPAELSFLEIKKAMVKWNDGEIKIKGRLALPAGVSYENVNSVGSAAISLSSLGAMVDESVDFDLVGNGTKWKYSANPDLGIHKFKIDWNGAKFNYEKDYLEIESHHFGVDTTTLEIETSQQYAGPVTIVIGSVTVSIDENDAVTVTPDTIEVDVDYDDYKTEIEVVLPFVLATTDIIDISGTVNDSVTVGDYYTAAVGKFKIKAIYDTTGIDSTTLDPSLTLDIALGDEGFRGILFIAPADWTKITDSKWKYKLRR